MPGKENLDLFSQLPSNEGSLPLDFGKTTGDTTLSKGETEKKTETSESDSVKSQPKAEKGESQRRSTHHVPPLYKKTVQEAIPVEPKNTVEPKSNVVVVQDKPIEKPEVESVKDKEEVKPAVSAVEAIQTPVPTDVPTPPVQTEAPVHAPALVAAIPAPTAPATPTIPASVPAVKPPMSPTAAQVEKSPETVPTPAPKRGRHPKVPRVENIIAIEKQITAPAVSVSTELKVFPEQKTPKEESQKPAKKTNAMEKFSTDNATVGQLLQEGRVRSALSIDQVSISTKIKKSFIESLERDDFENLPASVFVNAYTRALCSLYNIDAKLVFNLLNKVKGKNLDYTVPEEVILQLEKGKQVNIVQENKVKRMLIIGFAACLALAACISMTYYFTHVSVGLSSSTTAIKPAIDLQTGLNLGISAKPLEEDMEKKLMPPHVFTMTSLPLAER
jgi:hypothetical protein